MKVKVSDAIAQFFAKNNMTHLFGIIGAGNVHIFDSVYENEELEMVCVHHEQAACMAMQTYYRTSGKVTASVLTTGAGSTNGVTGVLSAWADSIPCLVISGNENSKYIPDNKLRMYGIQGYDSPAMVEKITKYATRVLDPKMTLFELEKALWICKDQRPGPCWIDIPMNIQSSFIEEDDFLHFSPVEKPPVDNTSEVQAAAAVILAQISAAERPVVWLGHGIRLAGAEHLLSQLLESLPAAYLVSWAGIDMVDSYHPRVYGRAGVYGQRCANFILQNSDYVLAIGTRLAIPQVGYDITEFARDAKVTVVDIDETELAKYPGRFNKTICADAKDFLKSLLAALASQPINANNYESWINRCNEYRADFPWVDKEHADTRNFINSYRYMQRLNDCLKSDQIIVTDMGTALLSGHQVLKLRPGQRLMTSTGLGEMGYGLPAAIGASFATNRGEVLCLNCDGGMMMNLQELQTIAHYKLPIKIVIFNNDGYLMIKHTQKNMANGRYAGVNKASGVSCPDFSKLAVAFDFPAWQIRTWDDFEPVMDAFMSCETPAICEVFMDPEQFFYPKLGLSVQKDGSLISPTLEDLSPFLDRALLEKNMIVGVHPKSRQIEP